MRVRDKSQKPPALADESSSSFTVCIYNIMSNIIRVYIRIINILFYYYIRRRHFI